MRMTDKTEFCEYGISFARRVKMVSVILASLGGNSSVCSYTIMSLVVAVVFIYWTSSYMIM